MIQFYRVGKEYPGSGPALTDVSFRVHRGEFAFLTGASGAGKSTLLKLIYRAELPSTGRILVNGRNVVSLPRKKVPYLRRTIGVVFQDFALIPEKTVFENIGYLPRILGLRGRSLRERVGGMLERVGLSDKMDAFPTQLSGGEQQRASIARALVNEPDLLIADEPTGNLDPALSLEIVRLFAEIQQKGTTVLVATHDPTIRRYVGDRHLELNRGRLVRDDQLARNGRGRAE